MQQLENALNPRNVFNTIIMRTNVPFCTQVVKNYLTFCGIGITNAQLFELSVMEYRRNQVRIYQEKFLHALTFWKRPL